MAGNLEREEGMVRNALMVSYIGLQEEVLGRGHDSSRT